MKTKMIGLVLSWILADAGVFGHAFATSLSEKRGIAIVAVVPPNSAPSWPAQRIFVAMADYDQGRQLDLKLYAEGWPTSDQWMHHLNAVVICLPPFRPAGSVISEKQLAELQLARARGAGVVVLGYGMEWPEFSWLAPHGTKQSHVSRRVDSPYVRLPSELGRATYLGVDQAPIEAESTHLEGPIFEGLLYARRAEGERVRWGAWVANSKTGGRLFGTAWIESDATWQKPNHRRILLNGILFATGLEPPIAGVNSVYRDYDATLQQLDQVLGREKLPEYQVIPAAPVQELVAAQTETTATARYNTWTVSHGDAGARRYSALTQINRRNVDQLRQAWIYHSKDGRAHIQSNPIVVDGVLYGPTAGRAMVALDAATGRERWRFQLESVVTPRLEDSPARRGLVYWPGSSSHSSRLLFTSGNWIYALDPATGREIPEFGEKGRVELPTGGTAAGVLCGGVIAFGGLYGDIFGYDPGTGVLRWRFHTLPRDGEPNADSWIGADKKGAHCWGGLAADQERGIIYAAIGNPHPLFVGVKRAGNNLYSNCLVAIDAGTGARLWHFQNIRHDIWDLDNPAPPNLLTVEREGRWTLSPA
jgi:outer membrane protein assembly factor BamB